MPTFDVYLARTYRVRMVAVDELTAERLAEEFIGPVADGSTPEQQAQEHFFITQIETVDNHSFDALLVDEGPVAP
ncbi:MAG: hypothetical protein WCF84_25675 [Anaerolineae bacterium]